MQYTGFLRNGIGYSVVLLVLLSPVVFAQAPIMLSNEQSGNLAKVKKYMDESPNSDSAFVYIRAFSKDLNEGTSEILAQTIHYSLALSLDSVANHAAEMSPAAKKRGDFAVTLLRKLAHDVPSGLAETVRPLHLWFQIQDAVQTTAAVTALTQEFIQKEVQAQDLYRNRAGRYGVMIFKELQKNPALATLSETLFTTLNQQFTKNNIAATETSSFNKLRQRAWTRYMIASLNLLRANSPESFTEKENHLRIAFENSPDRIDLNNYGFYYDLPFLFGYDKISFQNDYLTFLTDNKADHVKLLPVLLQMSLADPSYKNRLQEVYGKLENPTKNFQTYWLENVNGQADTLPAFHLSMLDGRKFQSRELSGKWILVDFWGTWCAPCREEHPDLEKLYKSYVLPKKDKMTIITIACNDTKKKVQDYMNAKKFTFPVGLSDGDVERTFAISYYPTKLLITPQGKYMRVPNGKNWVDFVKQYTGL